MSNVHIPLEHQSAPKQTDADKQVLRAVEEIASGQFVPDMKDEIWLTGTEAVAQHPAVQEALSKLQEQVQDKTSNEYLEAAHALHELNAAAMMDRQWPGQKRWEGKEAEEMRLVNLMTPTEFIEKLQKAGVSASVEPVVEVDYKADDEGVLRLTQVEHSDSKICLGRAVVNGVVGLFAHVPQEDGSTVYERVDKLQVPIGPEWTLVRFDEYAVPVGERYHGWRTAVLALIRRRILTEEQAHRIFGKPVSNEASSFYLQQLYQLRNA